MNLDNYKEIFLKSINSFEFLNPYINLDAEYRNRNYNALEKSKIPIKEIKQILKEEFAHYRISYENGRLRLRRQKGSLLFNFFFKYNSNIFQPYFEIYLNEEKLENLVNPLTSGVSLCRYLLNDREYPLKSKIFSNSSELIIIIQNEVKFFRKIH
jgi:hypothetical protein